MIYLLGALALVAALSGAFGAWEHKGKLRAEAQVGELQAKIETQNQAVLATKAEGDRRVAQARQGVAQATQATAVYRTEAERLRGLAGSQTPAGACPEAAAVAELRRNLK